MWLFQGSGLSRERLRKAHWLAGTGRHKFAVPHDLMATNNRTHWPAGDRDIIVGSPARAGCNPIIGNGLAPLHVHNCEIIIVANRDAAFSNNSKQAVGPMTCHIDKSFQAQPAFVYVV